MTGRRTIRLETVDRRSPWGVLHERDFRLLWIGETTSTLGTSVSQLALPLAAVVSLHASTFQVGQLTAAAWLPWLLIGLPAGAWVDRLPRRPLMLVSDGVSATLLLSVPAAAWAGYLTFTHMLLVALLAGTAGVFFDTALQVYQPEVVAREDLVEANSKLQGSAAVSQVAGPGIAGLLAQLAGAVTGVAADAVSFLVSAACLLAADGPRAKVERASPRPAGLARQVREGLLFLGRDPYLRVFTLFGAVSNLCLTGYQSILIVFLVREVGISAGLVGLLLAASSLGGVLGATIAGPATRRWGSGRGLLVMELGVVPLGLLIPLTANGPRLVLLVIGGIAIGTGVVAGNVIKNSFRQAYCPRDLLGRIVVGMQFLNYGAIPVGALLGGALGSQCGLRPTLWIMLSGVAVAPLVLLVGPIRQHRNLPTALPTMAPPAVSAASLVSDR